HRHLRLTSGAGRPHRELGRPARTPLSARDRRTAVSRRRERSPGAPGSLPATASQAGDGAASESDGEDDESTQDRGPGQSSNEGEAADEAEDGQPPGRMPLVRGKGEGRG